ncbi:MAG: nucleotidyl transferase AbiEii/AbiGii toxin family protein [Prevotella sp.]|nr:nucleotidyl transferase AbiEii/AbiGii toxin family protein [Prevotella sp.]
MTVFDEMLETLHPQTPEEKTNAKHEVMQQIALAGLWRGGFFEHAAFYGDTCLRIFHSLPRFSEDMDFTLTAKDDSVHLEDFFPQIIEAFKLTGREVEIKKKDKKTFGKVESAFLKDNTDVYDIAFQTEKTVKVKIELDTNPPLGFETEQKMLFKPFSFMTRCVTLPYLYAGKMHALAFRNWKTRVKGRDWYDFEWYVANKIPLDFEHLQRRIYEFNGIQMSKDDFMEALRQRLATVDMALVKEDVLRFLRTDPRELDIWSNDYFLRLADMIVFK